MIIREVELISPGDISRYAWSHLKRFHNVGFVAETIARLQEAPAGNEANIRKQAQQIRYCLQQAEEYADAARVVSLATRPNLLYYSTMCLALAEILMKQSGASSLDKAREEHRHHGLSLTVGGVAADVVSLEAVSGSMRAIPMIRKGARTGTFELWHRTARELPLPGVRHERHVRAARAVLTASDDKLPEVPQIGITLLECLRGIPQLANVLPLYGVQSDFVRGKAELHLDEKEYQIVVIFHPAALAVWERCYARITIAAKDYECVEVDELPNCCTMRLRVPRASTITFNMPHATAVKLNELRFWSTEPCLNEFGFYYAALFILGNYVRYYPDRWIRDVERSTPLAHVVEELTTSAYERVPLLALSELSRRFFVPGELD